jgi:hypothetical protein
MSHGRIGVAGAEGTRTAGSFCDSTRRWSRGDSKSPCAFELPGAVSEITGSPVPSRLRVAAHTWEFREVLHRGPKIAACLAVDAVRREPVSIDRQPVDPKRSLTTLTTPLKRGAAEGEAVAWRR